MDQTPELLCEGRFLRFMRRGRWEYVERRQLTGIVGIVAVTPAGELLLVEQFREAVRNNVIELPAGLAGDVPGEEGEALENAAQRELLEETGYAAETMTFLCEGPPTAGVTNEVITLFLADGLRQVGEGGGDASEAITVHAVPLSSVTSWLEERRAAGIMVDLRIYTGLYFLNRLTRGDESG
jgi:ADP-ribose pyrophosphatase